MALSLCRRLGAPEMLLRGVARAREKPVRRAPEVRAESRRDDMVSVRFREQGDASAGNTSRLASFNECRRGQLISLGQIRGGLG